MVGTQKLVQRLLNKIGTAGGKIVIKRIRKPRLSRSLGGDIGIFIFLGLGAAFMSMPLVLSINIAFKAIERVIFVSTAVFVKNPYHE